MNASVSRLRGRLFGCLLLAYAPGATAGDASEYPLKAAFLYNFARYTEWPPEVGSTLTLCIHGEDPFGAAIDVMQDKPVGERHLAIERRQAASDLQGCQIVYIAPSAAGDIARVIAVLGGRSILTIADSPGAARQGVALNMSVTDGRIRFEANNKSARAAKLKLSSSLLRLATQVIK